MSAGLRKLAIIAGFLFVGTLTGPVPSGLASPPDGGVLVGEIRESPAEIREEWSHSEMIRAATRGAPVPYGLGSGPVPTSESTVPTAGSGDFTPADPTASPYRAHGKVFFTSGGESFSCSGTLIDSAGRNVVATAGHCVYDRDRRRFVQDLIFAPAWNGNAPDESSRSPFGTWPARKIVTTNDFRLAGQLGVDVAFFTVTGEPAREVGSRKIAFDLDLVGKDVTILGYPARPVELFDGREMKGCHSTVVNRDNGRGAIFPAALWARPCNMGAGSSGGGWITPSGYLASVVSYGYCPGNPELCGSTYGPVLREAAEDLYVSDEIGGPRRPVSAIGKAPTGRILGRSASFEVTGSGSTPVSTWCRLDQSVPRKCPGRITFRNLDPGRHVFGVKTIDQTGKQSTELRRVFFVSAR